jgi:penicillin-binding protein 1A
MLKKTIQKLKAFFNETKNGRRLKRYGPALAVLLTITCSAIYLRILLSNLPSIQTLEGYSPHLVTKIYDCHDELITELYTERRNLIPLKDIPIDLQNAILATEDSRFFKHWGISPRGIFRAALSNVLKRRVAQGGSTITQQLAKVVFLSPERTIGRKFKELFLTIQLEHTFTKEEILEMYLNQIYFGGGAYGVEAAARVYFGKHVKNELQGSSQNFEILNSLF